MVSLDAKDYKKQPLMVPVDFSRHSMAALEFALNLAKDTHREVAILHVVHDPEQAPGYYQDQAKDGVLTMDDVAANMCEAFLAEAKEAMPHFDNTLVKTILVAGSPSKRILEVAEKIDAYMIIMGSHGRRGIEGLFIASKTLKVSKRSGRPVTIVKAPEVQAHIEAELKKKGKL